MNIPFRFTISSTNPYGILWNPWAVNTVANSVANDILNNLNDLQKQRYDLNPPKGQIIVTGLVVMGDTANTKVSLGVYDTTASAFVELYPIDALVVAGGGVVDRVLHDCGLFLPLAADRIPAIKYTPVSGSCEVTGQISFSVINVDLLSGGTNAALVPQAQNLQDEAGNALLTEAGDNLLIES